MKFLICKYLNIQKQQGEDQDFIKSIVVIQEAF